MFTHQHYVEIAKVLKGRRSMVGIVQAFVVMLEKDNKEFDAEKFLDIVYGKEE